MVGVAGKSKGCVTCKKRRIKCDEGKPICKRCEKSGYACGGYKPTLQFINASTAPLASQKLKAPQAVAYVGNTPITVVPRMRNAALPTELSLIAFQPEVCLSFLMHNFVWRTYGHGWLEHAAQERLDLVSTQAVRGLSNIFFGISNRQESIQIQACLQYGEALKGLRGGLEDLKRDGVENFLIPILLLLMHASYEEDMAAAISHTMGLGMLLHVAGPHRFQKGPIRRAFESARASLTTSSMSARKPLFLAKEEWKTIPWALDPSSKNEQNHIMDIFVDIPGFLAEDDARQDNADEAIRVELLARVKSKLFDLYCWRYRWELTNDDAAYETPTTAEEAKFRVITQRLQVKSYEKAAEMQLYNTVQLALLGLLTRLCPQATTSASYNTAVSAARATAFPLSAASPVLQLPHTIGSMRDPAVEIVRTFEFQMTTPDRNKESNLFFLFPLGLAWEVLKDEEQYRLWIRTMLDQTPVTSGYAVGRNRWFGKYYAPKDGVTKAQNRSGEIMEDTERINGFKSELEGWSDQS